MHNNSTIPTRHNGTAKGGLTSEEKEEASERQLAELEFIESAYSPEEAYTTKENGESGNGKCCYGIVRLVHLPVNAKHANDDNAVIKVKIQLQMPESYPIQEGIGLIVKGSLLASPSNPPYLRKAALNAIPQLVDACQETATEIASTGGGEAVFSVLARAKEWVDSEWDNVLLVEQRNALVNNAKSTTNSNESINGQKSSCIDNNGNIILGRRIIYSHHIIANSKRRDIANLTSEYKLGGYMKIGWPGVILIEGQESDCQLFVDEIKRWRWQQLQVRGEEQVIIPEGKSLDSHRQLALKFEELGEDDMSLLASNCREAGLEKLFLTCLKINDHRTINNSEGDEQHYLDKGDVSSTSSYGVLVHVDHMNDGKRYRKWLRRTCQVQECTLLIKQFYCNSDANNNNTRPTIYVGIFGDKDSVKQVMKLWRTSRVDVDSKNKPCLERMLSVVGEGNVKTRTTSNVSSLDDEDALNCSFEDLESLLATFDTDWAKNLRNRHFQL